MYLTKRSFATILASTLVACGGGGSDSSSSSGNYAGTWDISAVRVINDCAIPGVSSTFTASPVVNQDGTRVVVNSGTIVLTGTTNNEDGFLVTTSTGPDANGCMTGIAYGFKNASDGNAEVGLALVIRCPSSGNRECGIGYGGTGVRRGGRSLSKSATENTDIADIQATVGAAVVGGKGEIGQGTELETAETLADLVAPAQ